jgi:hypothetical protein|tara:strand:+ start:481 stop:654 length:174 start_codon:yes stop_codon:yes gene_type:complete
MNKLIGYCIIFISIFLYSQDTTYTLFQHNDKYEPNSAFYNHVASIDLFKLTMKEKLH